MNPISSMDEQFINKLTQIIDENLHDEDFGASELAEQLGISRVTLYRKVKSIIKKSVSEFIRETRLKRALELLKNKAGTASEISYRVGFRSPVYFNKCFHAYYGITPGEVLKGKHVQLKEKSKPKLPFTKKQFQIYSITILLVGVVFVLYYFVPPYAFRQSTEEKSVAVVLFEMNDLEENQINLIKTFREEIKNSLKYLEELKLVVNNNTEKYGFFDLNLKSLRRKSKANYIVSGKALAYEKDKVRIFMYLVDTKTGEILPGLRRQDIDLSLDEGMYNNVLTVTNEIKKVLTEKIELKKENQYTENSTAFRMYMLGLNSYDEFAYIKGFDWKNSMPALKKAQSYFFKAIEYDSNYVCPLIELGDTYLWSRTRFRNNEPINIPRTEVKDTVLTLTDRVIQIDPNYVPAYLLRAWVVNWGDNEGAIELVKKAIELDPTSAGSYFALFHLYGWKGEGIDGLVQLDCVINAYKYSNEPFENSQLLLMMNNVFSQYDFIDESKDFREKILTANQDTIGYFIVMQQAEMERNLKKVIEYGELALQKDSVLLQVIQSIGESCIIHGEIKLADYWYSKYIDNIIEKLDTVSTDYDVAYIFDAQARQGKFGYSIRFPFIMAAYAFQKNGKEKRAENLCRGRIDKILKRFDKEKYKNGEKFNLVMLIDAMELTIAYSICDQKENAIEIWNLYKNLDNVTMFRKFIQSPLLNKLRNEPVFKSWSKRVENKYKYELEQAEKILEKEGFLESL